MAIDIFPKAWGGMPGVDATPINGHPLAPKFGFLFNKRIVDIVSGVPVISVGSTPGTWSSAGHRRFGLSAREHNATTDLDRINVDANLIIPTANVTIVIAHQKTDGTNRNSCTIAPGATTTTSFLANFYVPFSDGTVYWDFGGESGANRVLASGLAFGPDDVWIATTGAREHAIYQNGISRATAAGNLTKSAWGAGTEFIEFGRAKNGSILSDLIKLKFCWIYHRQLSVGEIMKISHDPFQWISPRS